MVEMAALDGSQQRLDVVVVRLLVFGDLCGKSYIGAFTEVARFEETKAVAPGTGARYRRGCARTGPSRRPFCSAS